MPETVKIASKLPIAIQITEPVPDQFKDKPGLAPQLKSAVINGTNTRGAASEAVTHDVDADMFKKWSEANPQHADHLRVLGKDEEVGGAADFGFEPGLKKASEDGKSASDGSTVKDAGPVKASDMAATSSVPNDDSPRSQTGGFAAVAPAIPAPAAPAPAAVKK